ncbi:hypothetical protein HZH68_009766 [Vespula germanica]|uniref:Uncharacterized protein n=1 Tax=Vespula germanica TaxID=30212 RepID=A0A834K1X0_VESGE|nr:hypothetical protein HZH68_009766 [Vespula germanica]
MCPRKIWKENRNEPDMSKECLNGECRMLKNYIDRLTHINSKTHFAFHHYHCITWSRNIATWFPGESRDRSCSHSWKSRSWTETSKHEESDEKSEEVLSTSTLESEILEKEKLGEASLVKTSVVGTTITEREGSIMSRLIRIWNKHRTRSSFLGS